MDFIEELKWRGMFKDSTPGVEEVLSKGKVVGYIGFDPTAPSMTIGNYVQIMLLKLFQLSGHQPIILFGGATGRVGDPSGKNAERELKSYEELDANVSTQIKQAEKFLDFENGPNKAIRANNLDFYKDMNVLDFLRDVGKTLTINYMMSKDSVKNRIETGLSFTEFSYQLLQAYDYQSLYKKYDCVLQMGGSDQWGNITSGTEFIRRNLGGKAYAITTPLLTKADGSKFGKSTKGNLWLSPDFSSPYEFYQFWIRSNDEDLPQFIKYFSLKSRTEMQSMLDRIETEPQRVKEEFAIEMTERVHSPAALQAALNVSNLLFKNSSKETLVAMDADSLKIVAEELDKGTYNVSKSLIQNGVSIADLMTEHTQMVGSKGDVRRAIKNNAVSVNKEKVSNHEFLINQEALLHGKYIMLENGKKNKFMLIVE